MKTALISLRVLLSTVLVTAAAIMLVQSGLATPTPTPGPSATAAPVKIITGVGSAGPGIPVTPVTPTPANPNDTVRSGTFGTGVTGTGSGQLATGGGPNIHTKIVVTGLPREFHAVGVIDGKLLCPKYVQDSAGIWVLGTGCVIGASAELKKHTITRATLLGPQVQSACPAGFRSDGDFCFKPRSGGGVTGPGYTAECPKGWQDTGDACKKPETLSNCAHYKRGLGMGSAFSTPNNGGQCWACPGILHHNTFTGIDAPNACAAGNDDTVVWQSAQYRCRRPGNAG